MRQLDTKPMAGFNETQIDRPAAFTVQLPNGVELGYDDIISATPCVTSAYDGYARPQLVLGVEKGLDLWDESRLYPVGRLATFHGRNLEVLADAVNIEDSYGNQFGSLCIKGSDFTDPHLFESATASRDIIVFGLQESLVMERILRASKLLREHGIGTEYICGLSLPESFPLDKHESAIDQKNPTEFSEFLESLATRYAAENQNDKSTLENKTEVIERFSDCDYLITYRALDCPYRFGELQDPEQFNKFKQFRKSNTDDPTEIERIENQSVFEYLEQDFVPTIALNLAKLHRLGLVHGFLHRNNITALGSIVDLDSMKGEALGLGDSFEDNSQLKRDLKLRGQIGDLFECIRGLQAVTTLTPDRKALDAGPDYLAEKLIVEYIENALDTVEQKDEFFKELLRHTYDACYISNDGNAMYRCSQLIFGAYVQINPDILDFDETQIYLPEEKISPHFRRPQDSSFSILPTALIKDTRKKILKDPTPVNDWNFGDDGYSDASLNSMKQLIKNKLSIHFVIELLAADRKEGLSTKQIMVAIGGMLGELQPNTEYEDINSRLEKMQNYFYEQNKQFFSRLVRYHPPEKGWGEYKRPHEALSAETRRELHDCTAEVWPDSTPGRSPVYYLKDEAKYKKVLDELGIDHDTEIEFVNMQAVRETPDFKNAIILADYNKAQFVACHFWKEYALDELFTPELLSASNGDVKPTIIIRDVFGKPKVQIISYPVIQDSAFREKADYQDLLEEVTPKSVEPRQLVLNF